MLTLAMLRSVAPFTKNSTLTAMLEPLGAAMALAGIDTRDRICMFLAQTGHESAGYQYLREIASGRAYEGRADLGNTQPGDGMAFKGWGWMQTTGRKNTTLVSRRIYGDDRLAENPQLINPPTIELAAQAACDFWVVGAGENLSTRAKAAGVPVGVNLNDLADAGKYDLITLAVNGGVNGQADRNRLLVAARKIIVA